MTKRQDMGPVGGSAEADLLGALDLLRTRRAPYADPLAAIVAETLERFALVADTPDKLIAEIGAGAGQLREWLPGRLRVTWGDRLVHTDPSDAALRMLRQRAPQAKTRVATAERLPFEDEACGGVLGLCVLDAIQDAAAVVAELARVLCPRGRFVHFMDMATLLEAPFEKLAASGLIPLPNVFGDPADDDWPLDIVLVQRDWLAGLLALAGTTAHPLTTAFRGYFGAFLDEPFDAGLATNIFKAVASNGTRRQTLATLLESASRSAFQHGYPAIDPLPFHSGQYLQSVMETSFRDSDAFRIEQSEIVTRSLWRPRSSGAPRYQSLCLGHQRVADQLPRRLLTESAKVRLGFVGPTSDEISDTTSDETSDAMSDTTSDEMLIEVGVFVFVAQRV